MQLGVLSLSLLQNGDVGTALFSRADLGSLCQRSVLALFGS